MEVSIQEEFTSKFHSLDGITIGEKRKNLFLLLNWIKEKCQEPTKLDFSSIEPKTPLEENFLVESMLHFRKTQDLLQVLKGGHPILIGKTLTPWFVKEVVADMTGEELLQLFPHLSYITKLKLLHKLSLHLNETDKIDEFFKAVDEKYGKYLASQLICGCSKQLILHAMSENNVEITAKEMLTICKKYPEDVETFLGKMKQTKYSLPVGKKYEIVFRYLAQHNTKLFLKIHDKYEVNFKLGHRATATLIANEKESIIEDPKKFFKFLNKEEFGRVLKDKLDEVYPKIFPASLQQLHDDVNEQFEILKCLKSDSERLEMIAKTFKIKHNKELWDSPKFFNTDLIQKMSSERREKWMEIHSKPDDISEEEWISFMKTEKSIPLLKKKIACTSNVIERTNLLTNLVLTCAWNRDKKALVEVCKYAFTKHKNDHSSVREAFLSGLDMATSHFKLNEFSQDFWETVQDFINLSRLKGDYCWSARCLSEKHILYCMKNKLPFKHVLVDFVKLGNIFYNLFDYKEDNYKRPIYLMFNEVLQLVVKDDKLNNHYVDYLESVQMWNRDHLKQRILLFSFKEAMEAVKKNLAEKDYTYTEQSIAEYCIRYETESALRENLIPLLFNSHNYSFSPALVNFIWNHPLLVKEYAESIFQFEKERHQLSILFKTNIYKYYPQLGLPQKIASLCKNALDELPPNKLDEPALCLSKVLSTDEFLDLWAFDKSLITDCDNEEGRKLYAQRQFLFSNIRNILPPFRALDTLLKFSDKQHFHLTQKALQVIVPNVPENVVSSFLKSLTERSVLTKKHTMLLGFKVLAKNTYRDMIVESMAKETKPSMRKTLFRSIFKYFASNPDEHTWEMVKNTVSSFQPQDKATFESLSKCNKIPSKFFVQYVTFAWDVLQKCNRIETREDGRGRILAMIDKDTVGKISEEFYLTVQEEIFKSKKLSQFQTAVQDFVCRYVIYFQEDKMISIFERLENYVKESWRDAKHQEARTIVSNFVKEFCFHFLEKSCTNRDLLVRFITFWVSIFKPHEASCEYLHLNFTLIFVDASNENQTIQDIAEKILNLWESFEIKDVENFMNCFRKVKEKLLTIDDVDEETNQSILVEKVGACGTSGSLLLAICLFTKEEILDDRIKIVYEDIIARAMQHEDPLLQLHLHSYLVKEKGNLCSRCLKWF